MNRSYSLSPEYVQWGASWPGPQASQGMPSRNKLQIILSILDILIICYIFRVLVTA